jgi:hypothetical protein
MTTAFSGGRPRHRWEGSTRAFEKVRGLAAVRRCYADGGSDCYAKLWWWGQRSSGVIFIPLNVARV